MASPFLGYLQEKRMEFNRNRLMFLALLLPALASTALRADEAPAPTSVAHIRLAGAMEEGPPPSEPLFGASATFLNKLQRIQKAAKDENIKALYLQLDGLAIGWGKLDELTRAIAEFRKSGKKVFAYLEEGSRADYLLALACDDICVPEQGWLMLNGLSVGMAFFKDLFDKIGIEADFLQMGDFKAAAEPFTRNKMSEANRKQMESILDDFFDHNLVDRVIKGRPDRKWSAEHVKKLIDQGPFTSVAALKAGLVDRVGYPDTYQDEMKKLLKAEKIKIVKNYGHKGSEDIDLSNPFAILKLLTGTKSSSSSKPKVAVIYARGAIVTGKGGENLMGGEMCGSTTIVEAVRKAEEDKTVKAIVLRVDSPGGSALASDLMWQALQTCKKPVVASMSDVAASGGYYISMGCKKIYAEPGTITGSIGVIGGKLAMGKLYDKIGINIEILSRGENARLLTSDRPWNKSERDSLQALMRDCYDQFLLKAVEGRKRAGKQMTREQLEKLAGGRVWTGRQALENGLIDKLGTLEDAVADAWKMAGEPADKEPELLLLPKPRSFLDSLVESRADSRLSAPELRLLQMLRQLPEARRYLQTVEGLLQLRNEPVWLTLPYSIEIR